MKTAKMTTIIWLGMGLSLVLALITAIVLSGAGKINRFEGSLSQHFSINTVRISLTHEIINSMTVISGESRTLLLLEDHDARQESYSMIEDARRKCGEAFDELKSMENTEDGQALLARLDHAIRDSYPSNDIMSEPGMAKINGALKEVVRYQEEQSKIRLDQIIKDYRRWQIFMFLVSGITLAAGALIAFFMARGLASPARKHTSEANVLSPGKVNIEMETNTAPLKDPEVDTSLQSDEDILSKNLRAIIKTGGGSGVRPLYPPR